MTKEEFMNKYRIAFEEFDKYYAALPCHCGRKGCEGCALVHNEPGSIAHHNNRYGAPK
jgi:hypothetical protein